MPREVKVDHPWVTEIMFVGHPSLYPQSLYVLSIRMEGDVTRTAISPHVQRYYALRMRAFSNAFHPTDGETPVVVALQELRGFDFLGQMQPGKTVLREVNYVRYTYNLEAALECSNSPSRMN